VHNWDSTSLRQDAPAERAHARARVFDGVISRMTGGTWRASDPPFPSPHAFFGLARRFLTSRSHGAARPAAMRY
jgi:hypothetical protein